MDVAPDDSICIPCPAKINLTLAVGPPREDGYHPIASVMVPLCFHDALYLQKLDKGPSRFTRLVAPGCPKPMQIDWPIESDLVFRAHALLEQEAAAELPVDCAVSKAIPSGAGLGGGSSDAAGVLVGLRSLFRLPISDDRLAEIGSTLGADVGFMVHATIQPCAALATGVGEVIQPLPGLAGFDVVLVFPEGSCPTGAVYNAFDQASDKGQRGAALQALAQQWRSTDALPNPMNDLTHAAVAVCPPIHAAIQTLARFGYDARLTGSGSALFILAQDPAQADQIADQARSAGLAAVATRYGPAR